MSENCFKKTNFNLKKKWYTKDLNKILHHYQSIKLSYNCQLRIKALRYDKILTDKDRWKDRQRKMSELKALEITVDRLDKALYLLHHLMSIVNREMLFEVNVHQTSGHCHGNNGQN